MTVDRVIAVHRLTDAGAIGCMRWDYVPDQMITISLAQLRGVTSIVIGLCYVSVCVAFLSYLARKRANFTRWAFIAICVFLLMSGLSRFMMGFATTLANTTLEAVFDVLASLIGIPVAVLAWPLLLRLSRMGSAEELEELNKKLMHSQQLFEGFMQHSPSIECVKDSQLRFMYVNNAFCRTFGVKREDILGKTNHWFLANHVARQLHQSDVRVLQTQQPTEEVVAFQTANGTSTWLVVKFPIYDEQFMIGAIGLDITQQKAAEEREQNTLEIFRMMVSAVKDYAIFMLSPEGNIQTWNAGAERLKGYSHDEIVGKHFSIFYPEEVRNAGHPAHELELAKQNGHYEEEGWRIKKDGSRFWAKVTITPFYGQDGVLRGFTKVTRDLTDLEKSREVGEISRIMIDAVKDYAMFMLDTEGCIRTWNPGAERLCGYSADEIIGKNVSLLHRREELDLGSLPERLELAKRSGQYEEEGWRVCKDGSEFWGHITITPIYDTEGSLSGFLKVIRDMTVRREFETELAEQRDKAMEAAVMKSTFVANISHEIRTPLSGILGMNELLLTTTLDDEQREYAQTVQESSESLLTVLNDVLDLSKIEAGKLELDTVPFNVIYATQDATRLMAAAAKNKGLALTHQIDTGIPELLIGDPERFRQLLLNLVGNAVKFTHRGEVSVTAQLLSEDQNTATIKFEVKDTGIGIAEDERKYLFVPFAQVDSSSTRKFGGTGLGLAICKHMIEKMHGQIGVESEKGKGSTFWFTIPFPKTASHAADMASRRPTVLMPVEPTVLVVEDNSILQDLASKQLANLGIKCVVAVCGADAIEAINATQFDLILMDLQLPHVDGFEATKIIRRLEHARNRRTPIVAMTAKTMRADRERALAAGMDDYISKPVSLDTLRYLCEKWLAEPRAKLNGITRDKDTGKGKSSK